MSSLQDYAPVLVHWSFGSAVLVGLVASEFTGAETVAALCIACCASTLSGLCGADEEAPSRRRRGLGDLLAFLAIWLDALTNLVAASTCARLASATVDYITKGSFREFLFGLQQHSLGEPWPDVLGVTIVLVVTALFMLGLERSPIISALLALVALANWAFFVAVGGFHAVRRLDEWFSTFEIRSLPTVLRAAAVCSFGFVHRLDRPPRPLVASLAPLLLYGVVAVVFGLMTRHRELLGTAIPLIQVFENRDVDWARPAMAVFTVSVACLLLTEVTPQVYSAFVRLGDRDWRVLVSAIRLRSAATGAPVLAVFAAGSLAAILAFACPLSHLVRLLNVARLVGCALDSCRVILARYKADAVRDELRGTASVQYRKLNGARRHEVTLKERLRGVFGAKPVYVHRLASPKRPAEERERLLGEGVPPTIDGHSDDEENEMDVLSSCSDSSTDIDVIVEEYKEALKVAAAGGNLHDARRPATRTTFATVVGGVAGIVAGAVGVGLYVARVTPLCWPYLVGVVAAVLLVTAMPSNASERAKPGPVPTWAFPAAHAASVTGHVALASAAASEVWQGVAFWTLAGLLLYWKCECCTCDPEGPEEWKRRLPDHVHVAR
ncbi:probable cationic amino acid transporter [Cylas formicarius]|uniref:probable cationic amino acid transporter n=1 Tax=Cylas formicarius TaxID=197179 RepID=UPI00295898E5|nr:probable cationic amino acid transporter [Cylas formicarius]